MAIVPAVFVRAACLLLVLTLLPVPACSDSRSRVRESELVPFEAPIFDNHLEEASYIWAQLYRYIRDMSANNDTSYDSWTHVTSQYNALVNDLSKIHFVTSNYEEWPREQLARTPEILPYEGARQNAVALGICGVMRAGHGPTWRGSRPRNGRPSSRSWRTTSARSASTTV